MKLGVMQPYVFPYLGYFQLISEVDVFVFYDDVNFIKGGWVNRNRILLNRKDAYLTIPCLNKSPNRLIKDILVNFNSKDYRNLLLTIKQAYKKAEHFEEVFPLIEDILHPKEMSISELAIRSVERICKYLEIKVEFKISSRDFADTRGGDKSNRLVAICKIAGADHYINPIGGCDLYQKEYFENVGVQLNFLKSEQRPYQQFNLDFVPSLSIIDVLMFNSRADIKIMLGQYELQ